jgi:predicted Zn finger-like uncharacterized protein
MKIVCEACQAKYSISDDKVRGKAFKIRCKKCSHIIVVRSGEGSSSAQLPVQSDAPASASPSSSASAENNNWHIVVDGEQVGPLSTSDVRARLSRGEITGETFIWREGLADWLKVSAVPAFSELSGLEEDPGTPFPAQPPTTVYPPGTAESAFAASPGSERDVFAAPTTVSAPAAAADLFASPAASAHEPAPTPSFSFGAASPAEPAARHTHGNGAAAGGALTGQRHENSVLFSLSNLEALAAPNAPASVMPRPGVSGTSEGSGLIDIRSMAAMTLNSQSDSRPSNDLPTFGAPQFSPVAPVLLPIGQSSGPPTWMYVLIGAGLVVALVIGGAAYMLAKRPAAAPAPAPMAEVAQPKPAPTPAAAPVAAVPAAHPATPPATPPAAANEVLPPRDTKSASGAAEKLGKGGRKGAKGSKGHASEMAAAPSSAPERPSAPPTTSARAEAAKPNVGSGDKLDDLLNAALGSKKPAPRRDDEEAPARRERPSAPAAAALQPLEKSDIVKAMAPVNGRVKDCYNQYKVPGTAMVSLKLARGGKVSDASVSGKFAGTPTGACVEAAAKSARFPATDAQTIQYPFALH